MKAFLMGSVPTSNSTIFNSMVNSSLFDHHVFALIFDFLQPDKSALATPLAVLERYNWNKVFPIWGSEY